MFPRVGRGSESGGRKEGEEGKAFSTETRQLLFILSSYYASIVHFSMGDMK